MCGDSRASRGTVWTKPLFYQVITPSAQDYSEKKVLEVEADIVLDTMSLLDWIMMPVYALKGGL